MLVIQEAVTRTPLPLPLSLIPQPAQLGPASCPRCLWKADEAPRAAGAAAAHPQTESGMLGGPCCFVTLTSWGGCD